MKNMTFSILISLAGILICACLLILYWSKLNVETRLGVIITIVLFIVPAIKELVTNSNSDNDFAILNRPYLEPRITSEDISQGFYNIMLSNNGNVIAKDITYTIECLDRKSFQASNIKGNLAPKGEFVRPFSVTFGEEEGNVIIKVYYAANIKGKVFRYVSIYKFFLPKKNGTFNSFYSEHNEKSSELSENEYETKTTEGLDNSVGTCSFWFKNDSINEPTLLFDSKTKKIFYFPDQKIISFNWQLNDELLVNLNGMVPLDSGRSDNYVFTWEQTFAISKVALYINGELENSVEFKSE